MNRPVDVVDVVDVGRFYGAGLLLADAGARRRRNLPVIGGGSGRSGRACGDDGFVLSSRREAHLRVIASICAGGCVALSVCLTAKDEKKGLGDVAPAASGGRRGRDVHRIDRDVHRAGVWGWDSGPSEASGAARGKVNARDLDKGLRLRRTRLCANQTGAGGMYVPYVPYVHRGRLFAAYGTSERQG